MKTQKRLILLLLVIMAVGLSVGCTADPVATTAPTEIMTEPTEIITDPPTEPPTEAPTQPVTEPMDEQRLAEYQTLFEGGGALYFSRAAGYEYTRPEDVNLYFFFYNGVGHPGGWGDITESERERLMQQGFWTEMDLQIMPAAMVEEELQRYFGVGLADVTLPDDWGYSGATDNFYSNHSDAYFIQAAVTGYEDLPDGNVLLHLMVDAAHDATGDEWIWDAHMDMTLRPVEDGWQIASNVMAD